MDIFYVHIKFNNIIGKVYPKVKKINEIGDLLVAKNFISNWNILEMLIDSPGSCKRIFRSNKVGIMKRKFDKRR